MLCWILHTARICVERVHAADLLVLSLSFCLVVKMSAALLRGLSSPPHALLSPPQHVHLPSPLSTISLVSPVLASIASASRQFRAPVHHLTSSQALLAPAYPRASSGHFTLLVLPLTCACMYV